MRVSSLRVAGHFGEFLQGRLGPGGPLALVSVPCPALGVRASLSPARDLSLYGAGQRLVSPMRARRLLVALDRNLRGRVVLCAAMPAGGGAGASTAALVALARLSDPDLTPERIAAACVRAEGASDPLMFPAPETLLWASREGRVLRYIPPLPRLDVIGGFLGSPRPTDPADTVFPDISDLVEPWSRAACAGNLSALAELSTVSATRTIALRGPHGDPTIDLMTAINALGVVIGHTGSVRGFLFAPGRIPATAAAQLRAAGLRGVVGFRIGGKGCRTRSCCL